MQENGVELALAYVSLGLYKPHPALKYFRSWYNQSNRIQSYQSEGIGTNQSNRNKSEPTEQLDLGLDLELGLYLDL